MYCLFKWVLICCHSSMPNSKLGVQVHIYVQRCREFLSPTIKCDPSNVFKMHKIGRLSSFAKNGAQEVCKK